jgi:hypothetical protein
MRLPRMTTRWWMVAVVGVFLTAARSVYLQRQLAHRQRAAYHEKIERLVTDTPAAQVRANAAIRDRHARLKEKYWRAARYPWLPVEPDPPEPEKPFSLEDLHNIDVPSL